VTAQLNATAAPAAQAGPGAAQVAALLRQRRKGAGPYIVAITGSVASGKSTFAAALCESIQAWPERPRVELVCTDGFLLPNAALETLGLLGRKGFPETYDVVGLRHALADIRRGPAAFPAYSHVIYDIDPALTRVIDPPDVLIVEGLCLHIDRAGEARPLIDDLIYLDAQEDEIESWFSGRFMDLWRAAAHDPASFYARFRHMSEEATRGFAHMVWTSINLPNLRDHIAGARASADIVVRKGPGHAVEAVIVASPQTLRP
jgi:type I pantothenate kinase